VDNEHVGSCYLFFLHGLAHVEKGASFAFYYYMSHVHVMYSCSSSSMCCGNVDKPV
jgi:hypothetical protein